MMNVDLHRRGGDPQLRAVLQSELDRRLNDQVVDRFQRLRSQTDEPALEGVVLRHRGAVEVGEPTCGCTGYGAGPANPEAKARDPSNRFVASARHPKAIPNQHASFQEFNTTHMYVARK